MARINKKRVKDALHKYKGAAYLAAKHINCTPKTIYNYINKYDDLREIKEDYDEEVNDIAELGLRESVIAKREWAIKYQLSTKGKSRGYVERQEIGGLDGEPIAVKMIEVVLPPEDGDATN